MNDSIDTDSKDLWERAKTIYLSTLRSDEERNQAENYFSMITSVTSQDGYFTIYTSNQFAADFLNDKYAGKLKSALDLAGGDKSLNITFKHDETAKKTFIVPVQAPSRAAAYNTIATTPVKSSSFISSNLT